MYTKWRRMQSRVFKMNKRLHRKPTPAGASAGRRQALCPAFTSSVPWPPWRMPSSDATSLKALPRDPWTPHIRHYRFTSQTKHNFLLSLPLRLLKLCYGVNMTWIDENGGGSGRHYKLLASKSQVLKVTGISLGNTYYSKLNAYGRLTLSCFYSFFFECFDIHSCHITFKTFSEVYQRILFSFITEEIKTQ